jgi:negative regulator of sigma E activity
MNRVPEAMPDMVAEQLSAWLDDELPAAELELLVARLGQSSGAHGRLERYGLIGAALRGGPSAPDAWQLGERVRRALEAVPEYGVVADQVPATTGLARRWQDNIVPFAAAATVLLTLFLMATIKNPSPAPYATAQAGGAGMFVPVAAAVEPQSLRQVPDQTLISRQRLTDYLVLHGEYTGGLVVQVADSHIVNDRSYAAAILTRPGFSAK